MSVPFNPWGLGLAPGTPHGHLPLTRYERESSQLPGSLPQPVAATTNNASISESVHLEIRQQPKEALLTSEGKEKARKPVDPPPIIQLKVDGHADPPQHFLQSPYLFMCVTLWDPRKNQPVAQDGKPVLAGSLVSSLHRLKDVDNRDGGFFVFGDVSVKVQGTHRLHFSLFDLHKDTFEVVFLKSITSEPFRVVLPKDFKGMDESTYLSRAFSDQGVRLRLRKEPRAMMGSSAKRAYTYGPADAISGESGNHEDGHSTPKRQRTYGDSDEGEGARNWEPRSHYGDRQSISQSMLPYQQSGFGGITSRTDYLRTPSTSFPSDSLSTTLSGLSRYPDLQSPYPQYGSSYSNVMRPSLTSTTSFRDEIPEDRYRTGASQSQTLTSGYPQTPTHSSHDSMGSSRGPTFSQSPEALRSTYTHGSNSFSLPNLPTTQSGAPTSLATGYRPPGRYDDRVESAFADLGKRHQPHDLGLALSGGGGELPHSSISSYASTYLQTQQLPPQNAQLQQQQQHGGNSQGDYNNWRSVY